MRRPLFQFHLSTAFVMMVVASLWVGANTYQFQTDFGKYSGFPFPSFLKHELGMHERSSSGQAILWTHDSYVVIAGIHFNVSDSGWCYPMLAINLVIGLFVLAAIAALLEWRIRR